MLKKEKKSKEKCPSCKKHVDLEKADKKYLPFCSARCQMMDLGQWLSEKYTIPSDEHIEDNENEE